MGHPCEIPRPALVDNGWNIVLGDHRNKHLSGVGRTSSGMQGNALGNHWRMRHVSRPSLSAFWP